MRTLVEAVRRVLPDSLLMHAHAVDHYFNGEPELRLLKHLCRKDKVSLDIGSNIGIYTYFMTRHSRHVCAFEPNPVLCERLRRLFPNVTVRHAAASDRAGRSTLAIPVEDGRIQHELASVAQDFGSSAEIVKYDVPCIRIDDEGFEDVGFIKVDVEQHEIPVLRGCLETIRQCKPIVMTEVTPLLYPRPFPVMFDFITEIGYDIWFRFEGDYIPGSKFIPETHANPDLWGRKFMNNNVIFLPTGHDTDFLAM